MSFGLIGLGKMGANLALNISKNRDLNIYNRTTAKTFQICDKNRVRLNGFSNVESFIENTETPRKIITMMPNGINFDNFLSLMDPGDVIIDCANEHYEVSSKKDQECSKWGVQYLGVGMSGGAFGALHGPAVMIGGNESAWKENKEFFETFCNNTVYIGTEPDVGHFTKMVHNGVEYSMLQCIADIYSYCNHDGELTQEVLQGCDQGYLTETAQEVLRTYSIDKIVDDCKMNSTGLWCSQYALEHNIPLTTIHTSVQYRINSSQKYDNNWIRNQIATPNISDAQGAIRFVFALAFYEGLSLVKHKGIDPDKARQAWSKFTIIRCDMTNLNEQELLMEMDKNIYHMRNLVKSCVFLGINIPVLSAALQYYEFTHTTQTQMALIMAQRNYFGNHEICFHNNITS